MTAKPETTKPSNHIPTQVTCVHHGETGSDILFDAVTVHGKAEPNTNVFVKIMDPAFGQIMCGNAIANRHGNWALTWDLPFSSGSYAVRLRGSSDHPFYLGEPGPCAGLAVC